MSWFKKKLPYSKELLQFLHERIDSDSFHSERKTVLHSILYMGESPYIDTMGFSNHETGESLGPLLYFSSRFESPVENLEPPFEWMPLIWVFLRHEFLPRAYEMFGPTMKVVIEDEDVSVSYETTLGELISIVENDYFRYWEK